MVSVQTSIITIIISFYFEDYAVIDTVNKIATEYKYKPCQKNVKLSTYYSKM